MAEKFFAEIEIHKIGPRPGMSVMMEPSPPASSSRTLMEGSSLSREAMTALRTDAWLPDFS
jgi:hypothetical protein